MRNWLADGGRNDNRGLRFAPSQGRELVAKADRGPLYHRGQVEWALWKALARPDLRGRAPPNAFVTRIKRLLEIDREGRAHATEVPPQAPFAFSEGAAEGSGSIASFTAFDAFCLAFALELMDIGFKQSEAVFLIAHVRPDLEEPHARALKGPPFDRQRRLAKHYPDLPSYDGGKFADPRIFVVLDRIELPEMQPDSVRGKRKGPLILEPKIYGGIGALFKGCDQLGFGERRALVFEIAGIATAVAQYLEMAPEIRRGRPRSPESARRS